MATEAGIAMRRGLAVKSIDESLARIARAANMQPPALPYQKANQIYIQMRQLEEIAAWLKQYAESVDLQTVESDDPADAFRHMSVSDLQDALDARGIAWREMEGSGAGGRMVKDDLLALMAKTNETDASDETDADEESEDEHAEHGTSQSEDS